MTKERGQPASVARAGAEKQPNDPKRSRKSPPGGRSSVRSEQQRSIESRSAILEAALAEFADKGYDAASIRTIGERAGIHFTLVTYHFKNKRKLWEATISHFFEEVSERWRIEMATMQTQDPFERLRHQFHSFLKFSVKHPNFHRALLHENRMNSPRLEWVIKYFVKPIMDATIPNILKSQKEGLLIEINSTLLYYLLFGACAALSSAAGEISEASDLDIQSDATISEYWHIIDTVVLNRLRPESAAT